MSALPNHTSGSSPLPKTKTRECSRNRPSTDRTRMFSESPGSPGLSAQIPRTHTSTGTPAMLARYSASMTASSTIELTLIRTYASRPARWCSISWWIRATRPARSECGATSRRR